MFLLLASFTATALQEPFRPEYEAYSRCVQKHFQSKDHEIASLKLLRRMVLPKCRVERARLVTKLSDAQLANDATERREGAEAGVSVLEQYLPGTFRSVIVVVPAGECVSRLRVRQWCLE